MAGDKVLIVEDEYIIAMDLEARLLSMGYRVIASVSSSEEALEVVQGDRPDVVLMDIMLKGGADGIDTADILRNRYRIPVIFTTAYADEDRLEKAKPTFPFGYLIKPYQNRDVRIAIEMALYAAKADARRSEAESALRESERFNAAILDSLPAHVAVVDERGTVLAVNSAWTRFASENGGHPSGVSEGVNYYDVCRRASDMGAAGAREALEGIQAVVQGKKETFLLEYPCHSPDEKRWFLMRVTPMADHRGRSVIAHHDISERKRTENSLIRSQKDWLDLFNAIDDAVIVLGSDFRIEKINKAALGLMNTQAHLVVGRTCHDVFKGSSAVCSECPAAEIHQTGAPHYEERFEPVFERYCSIKTCPIFEKNGTISRYVKLIRDINERKVAETRLFRLNEIFDHLGVDPTENIRTIVRRSCEILDGACCLYGRLENEGSVWKTEASHNVPSDFPSERKTEGSLCHDVIVKEAGRPLAVEDIAARPSSRDSFGESFGNIRSYLGQSVIVGGERIGVLCILDVRKRRFSTADLQIISTLAKALSLEEERRSAQEKTNASLREKDVLLQEIHHRVKNNMQVISSLLSIKGHRIQDEESLAVFQECRDQVLAMAQIHEMIYRSSNLAEISLQKYAETLGRNLLQSFHSAIGRVLFNVEAADVTIHVDHAVPIALALNELLTNALKHAFKGRTEGALGVYAREYPENIVEIEVRDDGRGFPPDYRFEVGPGRGLNIVKGLVESQLGGTMEVISDKGARFILRFRKSLSVPATG